MDQALSYVKKMVVEEDNVSLTKSVTDLEMEEVVFHLGANKAQGSDSFSALFFQSSWKEGSKEVCGMVHEFFEGRSGLKELNATNIVLIPKIVKLEGVHHFRPIGLCNVAYKLIAKILTNRLMELMENIISCNQRVFMVGRMIQDNIILTHEAFHYLKNKKTGGK
ncbi:hypothetical protein QN277_019329 [Acacia crassicarpa]|uniref:Reverse transcriptase domain-containing protein n=1 Tax=Acacia crassicarpa TaxID=499986 RepID=A0AAE1JYG8_9FABA|nr:hypothetical protein QN277_019329 [Acacia crassicarpa]